MKNLNEFQVVVKRFKRKNHFIAAAGYNCPKFPSDNLFNSCDYEVVKVVKTGDKMKSLKGRKIIISWGLNLDIQEQINKHYMFVTLENDGIFAEKIIAVCS